MGEGEGEGGRQVISHDEAIGPLVRQFVNSWRRRSRPGARSASASRRRGRATGYAGLEGKHRYDRAGLDIIFEAVIPEKAGIQVSQKSQGWRVTTSASRDLRCHRMVVTCRLRVEEFLS